jgi:flagellar biosynthesis protein FlhA
MNAIRPGGGHPPIPEPSRRTPKPRRDQAPRPARNRHSLRSWILLSAAPSPMRMPPARSNLARLLRNGDLLLTLGLFATVLLMILPVSPLLLDGFLATSIALSLLILLVILYVKEPADFTGFPTLLLFVTLFRLALNIATDPADPAGRLRRPHHRGLRPVRRPRQHVVGLVVFAILVIINFIVITKGAGRIAEVAARFTLDAMPGKQMAIDAELNAGVINETEARNRRRKVEQEADFYGAMDGASKFVRGDAIAAILITLINVLGGFAIGILQRGMTVSESLQRYTLLSIGDGLVSQIPALITSTAAGILITRAAAKEDLGKELGRNCSCTRGRC